ncbi:MAG: Cell filamentation protein Fic [uncultured Sulfurovum sp.]|uniref:Cell filamentation protein Fic n=1 Tax=uncultured Sulfurovum sp. TaxID=269237 RepID=A0A6S6TB17_9BACT|nr:MAG: Cell filamentation protein Fic [uncultured Sulfurovum sp.]
MSDTKEAFLKLITAIIKDGTFKLSNLYSNSESLDVILEQIDDLKKSLESFRPLEGRHIEKLDQYLDEVFTYDSTGIEGNTLTLQETSLVLNKGVTIGGKSLREHFEIVNHKEAIDYIKNLVKNEIDFDKRVLLDIHHLILKNIDIQNAGKFRNVDVMISGSAHKPPTFLQVDSLIENFFKFYEENKKLNPVILSAEIHERLVTIHPFVDGNGRTSRLLMNLILLQHGFPITNISSQNTLRDEYYKSLETTQTEDNKEVFHKFIAKNVKDSLIKYLEIIAVNGEENIKGEYFYKRVLELSKK